MRIVANSSSVSKPKSYSKTQTANMVERDRQVTTIKPSTQSATTSWRSRPVPLWFLHLTYWQRRFGIATYLLIAAMLAAYSSTVYFQQRWNQQLRKLENLQRHERQLTTTNEVLKNQLASEAEQPSTGLMPPNPADAIILNASPAKGDRLPRPLDAPPPPKLDIPAGY